MKSKPNGYMIYGVGRSEIQKNQVWVASRQNSDGTVVLIGVPSGFQGSFRLDKSEIETGWDESPLNERK
jgi:hypothetical protein